MDGVLDGQGMQAEQLGDPGELLLTGFVQTSHTKPPRCLRACRTASSTVSVPGRRMPSR
jgi:hypothetical protein